MSEPTETEPPKYSEFTESPKCPESDECPVCYESTIEFPHTCAECGKQICSSCFFRLQTLKCPICRAPYHKSAVQPVRQSNSQPSHSHRLSNPMGLRRMYFPSQPPTDHFRFTNFHLQHHSQFARNENLNVRNRHRRHDFIRETFSLFFDE
jgi:hypothetical protein